MEYLINNNYSVLSITKCKYRIAKDVLFIVAPVFGLVAVTYHPPFTPEIYALK